MQLLGKNRTDSPTRKSSLKPLVGITDTNGVRDCGHHFFMRPAMGKNQSHADVASETEAMKADHTLDDAASAVSQTILGLFLTTVVMLTSTGCRLCCDVEDIDYPAYGGAWERTNRSSGRVGSLFDPGGARIANLSSRESADDGINDVFPGASQKSEGPLDDSQDDPMAPKSDADQEKEFQERYEKMKNENQTENPLKASIIPGAPIPPDLRY